MINAMQIAIDLHAALPSDQRPERTEGYEGFYHLLSVSGTVERMRMEYIIRDHDRKLFEQKKELLSALANQFNRQYPPGTVHLVIKDQYYNMREKIEPVMYTVHLAEQVMMDLGIKPLIKPIRGGTDGAKLSFMGLPTPNLFTGGYNYHGRYEFIPLESMKKATEVVVGIIKKIASP